MYNLKNSDNLNTIKKMLLILNPVSGTKKAAKNLADIVSVFNCADFDVRVYVTSGKGDATYAVKRFGNDADIIVCCGGDGTLNETVIGVMENGTPVNIGYIPSGSTNDFATSLQLPDDVTDAAKQITQGTAKEYDVGKFNDKYFVYVASFGAFTKASYSTPQNAKNALGHMAYILSGIQELSNIRNEHIRIEIDGEFIEDDFLFGAICNSTSVGGILTLDNSMVNMTDGKFEILLVKSPKDLQELGECIFALTNKKYDSKMIVFRTGSHIKISADENLAWSLDGEKNDGDKYIEIENLNKQFKLVH